MEETKTENDEITRVVMNYIENRGVTKRWFYELLDITQPTFNSRLEGKTNWKRLEISTLKQYNIIK